MKRLLRWLRFFLPECSLLLIGLYTFCLPDQLFADPACTVLEDRDGNLLSARIAADGQWRFPYNEKVPFRFKEALIQFEDRDFYEHPGVSSKAIARAVMQNSQAMEVKSGGSTLTMQLARMMRKRKNRGLGDKLIESILATRIEIRYSKEEILAMYASNAPFGGNVVGLDAAAWRYFGRAADKLSWAESATLAVLP
ncbi:MAG: penicillin-binding protein, partial [Bacteroidota bacterium]